MEMRERVRSAVETLTPDMRMVVVLRYTEGLSYEEIAEVMGCSVGTVASRLNRAHKALERKLSNVGLDRSATGALAHANPGARGVVGPHSRRKTRAAQPPLP